MKKSKLKYLLEEAQTDARAVGCYIDDLEEALHDIKAQNYKLQNLNVGLTKALIRAVTLPDFTFSMEENE